MQKKNSRVLLKDIAEEAGCSVAAVSRALSGNILQNHLVSNETSCRIQNVARQLGYTPHYRQQHKAVGIVGVFIPPGNTVLTLDLINAVTSVANKFNTPIHCYSNANADSFNDFMHKHFDSRHIQGVLSYYPPAEKDIPAFMDMYKKLTAVNAPLVVIHNNAPEDFPAVTVKFDNYYGGQLAGKYLKSLNCREYFILGSNIPTSQNTANYNQQRQLGCYNALTFQQTSHCHMMINNRMNDKSDMEDIIEKFYRMVDWKNSSSVGIFCDYDGLALALHSFLQSRHIDVGIQAKIVGYNDEEFAKLLTPALTTVRQPFKLMGETAMYKLFNMMQGKKEKSQLIHPELIIRAST